MPNFVERVNWQEYLAILELGEPTIAVQLLVVNVALLLFWLLRRTKAGSAQQRNGWLVPMMFAMSNIAVFTLGHRLAISI